MSNNISGAKSIELCKQNAAIVADAREDNSESKLDIFKEQHPNLNMFGLTMVRIDQLEQLRHLMGKRCLRSNKAKKPKPEVITVVVPLSTESVALCMVDGQTLLGDLHFDLASSEWIDWPEQWTLHAKGMPLELWATISEVDIAALEVLTVQREGLTDLQRELRMLSSFEHVLKIGIVSPVREIRPCISESETHGDFRIANTAGLIYNNLSIGSL